jgi:hypothetical protein
VDVIGRVRSVGGVRLAAYAGLLAVLVAMVGPPLRDPPRDSYPLSTYPMFSSDRGRVSLVATAVGIEADGTVRRLNPHLIAGSDEVMLSVQTATNAVRAGTDRSEQLCEQVAQRVAGSASHTEVDRIVVRVEEHDAVSYFADGDRTPVRVDERASCEVPRP